MTSDKPTQAEMERAARQRDDKNSLLLVLSDIGIYGRREKPSDSLSGDLHVALIVAQNAIRKMRLA